MTIKDKTLIRKRSAIETIKEQLKNIAQAQHSMQPNFGSFTTNLVARLLDFSFEIIILELNFKPNKGLN